MESYLKRDLAMTEPENNNSAPQWNTQLLAARLDTADDNTDEKIIDAIWNTYLKPIDSTGNSIDNYIAVDDTARSLDFYTNILDTGNLNTDWDTDIKACMPFPPYKDKNLPAATTRLASFYTQSVMNSDIKAKLNRFMPSSTFFFKYKGEYIAAVYDKRYDNNPCILSIQRNNDGSINSYAEYEYDENSKNTRIIIRNANGSIECYADMQYKNGRKTRTIERHADGSLDYYIDYIYDENGEIILILTCYADAGLYYTTNPEYGENVF